MFDYFSRPQSFVYESIDSFDKPFENVPDYRFLYLSKEEQFFVDKLLELMKIRASHLIITGEAGIGKTILAKMVKWRLSLYPNHFPLYLNADRTIRKVEFWKILANHCGLPKCENPLTNQSKLYSFLYRNSGKFYFDLIVDNAHLLSNQVARSIFELDSFRNMGSKMIQMVLLRTIDVPKDSFGIVPQHYSLKPLSLEDVRKMIEYRLYVSGSPQRFSDAAVEKIFNLSRGNPRKILFWCRAGLEQITKSNKSFIDGTEIDLIYNLVSMGKSTFKD